MEYEIKKGAKSTVEITVTVEEERLKEFRKKACDEISRDVKVKGFRPGHVPMHVLEQHIDAKYIEAHTEELAIQKTYAEVVIKEKIQVVSRPKVKIETHSPLKYIAEAAVMPEVEVKDYKGIKVKKEEIKVTKKEIDEIMEDLKKQTTHYHDVDRAAKKGDRAEIDFEGFDKDGKSVENTKSKNHPVIIGENSLIPGFEDHIVGMKKDQEKEFDITFPKDYQQKDFQGKTLKFKIKLGRIEEAHAPEVNEEFVEKITGKKDTVKSLEDEIEKNLIARKTQENQQAQENEYIEKLLKVTKAELPEALIDEEVEFIIADMKENITMKGMEFEKFLEQAKTTMEDLRKKYRPEAERRIKIRLALQYIIKEEDIKATDAEIEKEFAAVKANYPQEHQEKVEGDFIKGELRSQLYNKIALGKLFEKVLG